MSKAWYIRTKDGLVKGPFPAGQICQEVLLGRYPLETAVSHDKEEWLRMRDIPELVPEVFKGAEGDPDFNEKLAAARRWADERRGIESVSESERRKSGSYEDKELKRLHRMAMAQINHPRFTSLLVQFLVVAVLVAGLIWLAFQFSPEKNTEIANCNAAPQKGVNWNHCSFVGRNLLAAQLANAKLNSTVLNSAILTNANLSHANLSYASMQLAQLQNVIFTGAILKGANLQGANLSGVKFYNADLSYANLSGSILVATDFTNAKLDHAIWRDGRKCKPGSVGKCH